MLVTDASTYSPGATVNFKITATNHSTRVCSVQRSGGCRVGPSIYDSQGTLVWPTGPQPMCASFVQAINLQPGQSDSVSSSWGQQTCGNGNSCGPVPLGTYTAKWTYTNPAEVTFKIS